MAAMKKLEHNFRSPGRRKLFVNYGLPKEETVMLGVRVTQTQKKRFLEIGGSSWLRKKIMETFEEVS